MTIFESIKALEIKTSMLFNLNLANNTILSCFFFFFLIIDLYFLIPAVIAQVPNPAEDYPSVQYNSKLYKLFYTSHSLVHFDFF